MNELTLLEKMYVHVYVCVCVSPYPKNRRSSRRISKRELKMYSASSNSSSNSGVEAATLPFQAFNFLIFSLHCNIRYNIRILENF